VLYTAHGFHFYKGAPWPYWLFYYPAERLAAHWTDGLIVMNSEDYERAQRMGFKPGKNLFFVHGVGVDLEQFSPAPKSRTSVREELGLSDQDIVVMCVAEFTSTKNHAFLLAAWSKVAREEPCAHLLLIGDGQLKQSMERRIRVENIPNVHFLGFRGDVPRLLQSADIFVLPSRREGLPRSIMEAMAAGKPVVATDVRGNRDLVGNGVTGILVKLGDVVGLAQAILQLIHDPELRLRMGEAGREKMQAYSLDHVIKEMSEIYARYLSSNR
jgi:glycosyltransferase involved in cell wall biosynthesis